MKTNQCLVLALLISFTFQGISGQKIFREGYIVKKTGETLIGLVEYEQKKDIPSICTFKRFDIARPVVYTSGEILAFGYKNGNRYELHDLNNKMSFFEVLVAGKIVLYNNGSKYYLDKDHQGLVELKNGPVTYSSGNEKKQFKSLTEFLVFVTEGKAGTINENFNVKNDIIPLITAYNKVSGQSYYVFNRSITEKQLTQDTWKSGASKNRFGVVSGVNIYTLNLMFNPNRFGNTLEDYVPTSQKEMGPVVGLSYERQLFRKSDRFSLRVDLLYNSQSFSCYSERENTVGGTTRDNANFNFKGIKFPILLQYALTGARVVPYVNAGLAYQFFINSEYLHTYEVENTFGEIKSHHDENMLFKSGEFTGAGGLGVRTRILRSMNVDLRLMLEYGKGLFFNTDPTDPSYMKNDPYVESSFQSTFMIGITF